jgi:hypothetical protein
MYSPELINRAKKYFHEKCGLSLSDEQAVEYLDALADLYRVMGRVATAGSVPPSAPDLIYVPHSDYQLPT